MHAIVPHNRLTVASAAATNDDALALLSSALDPSGWICIFGSRLKAGTREKERIQHFFAPGKYQGAIDYAMSLDRAGYDSYWCASTLKDKSSRMGENAHALKCLRLDFDVGTAEGKYATLEEAQQALAQFLAGT